ncbi:MAG: hypothetical protein R3Y21_03450 [Mycoplasmatota bacterium]
MVMLDQQVVMNDKKLKQIKGGFTLSASFVSAIVSSVKIVFEIGQSFGSAFRRSNEGNLCTLD